ncbi:MAG TPA: hypothetical protein ENJ16_04035 [Planctomycetaceae bacterium]|nr:hypothetical protein [Planctomycetaceae bacterium]
MELRLPGESIREPGRISVEVPGYVASEANYTTSPCSITLARAASIDLEIFGLPDGFLERTDVTFEIFPENPDLRISDRLTFPDQSFVDLRTKVIPIKATSMVVRGLVQGMRYASDLRVIEDNVGLSKSHFTPPQTVRLDVQCSRYIKVTCDRPVEGVLAAADRERTAKAWCRTAPIVDGVGFLHLPHDFSPTPRLAAWGGRWVGDVERQGATIHIRVQDADNYRVFVDSHARHEAYIIQNGQLHRLGEYSDKGQPAAWFADDHFVVRGVEPGQQLLIRNVDLGVLDVVQLPTDASDVAALLKSRPMGVIAAGPEIFRNAMRRFPARSYFVVLAVLVVDGRQVECKLRLRQLDEWGIRYFGREAGWRFPQLPDGGRFVASIQDCVSHEELGRFELKWNKCE